MKHLLWALLFSFSAALGLQACTQADDADPKLVRTGTHFWAKLLVMDESGLAEFEKPADQTPVIKEVGTAKRGDRVALKLILTGMALDSDMMADVKFNISVTSPNGKPYDGGSHDNVPAFQSRVLDRERMYNSPAVLVLAFDPDDQLGTYDIRMRVTDNVGGVKLDLRESVDLEP